jgi:transposase
LDTDIKQGTRKGSPNYSIDFKRRLAIAACEPDISVSKLALAHQVNANMVFKWRRQYRAGLLGTAPAFLPVALVAAPKQIAAEAVPPRAAAAEGSIEIRIADAVVRVHGAVDAKVLRTVLQSLRP